MAKLSSREQAVKAKKKASVAPKVSSRAVASKSPLVGAGPLMTGQARVGATAPAIGPMLQGQTRDMAAKAQAKKSTGGAQTLSGSTLLSKPKSKINIGSINSGGGVPSGPNQNMSPGPATSGFKGFLNKAFGEGSFMGDLSSAGLVQGNAGRLAGLVKGSTPSAYASEGDQLPGQNRSYTPMLSGEENRSIGDTPGAESIFSQNDAPFSRTGDTNQANALDEMILGGGKKYNPDNTDNYSRPGDKDQAEYFDSPEALSQLKNEEYGGDPMPDVSTGTTGNRSGRGSGMFGTGKGLSASNDDPYIKELRKAYSSNGGEKWLRKQFEELIAALDPTYAQMQKEGTDALNAQLYNNNTQLASVMNANNTGDSEQRAQLMAGQQRDSQASLANLLAKLSQNKAQDISGYRSQMAEKMGQYRDKNQTNQQRLISEIQNYRSQQQARADKQSTGTGTRSYGTAIDNIMATKGVDVATARKIYNQENGLVAEKNPQPSGEFRVDPQDGQLKQLYIVDGQLGFLD